MTGEALKLTIYFGERDRIGKAFLADALSEIYDRHELAASIVMRGVEGFGIKHRLSTDRLLTLSEDLPVVSVAIDRRECIERVVAEVNALSFEGLVTLERIELLDGGRARASLEGDAKLTVYLGRGERVGAAPAYRAVVSLLHERGLAGASVLLGVDGTSRGERRRATFFGANAGVPMMVVAVGSGASIDSALPDLVSMLGAPQITLERVTVCKRDGALLRAPGTLPTRDDAGRGVWQKLTVYAGEQSRIDGKPLQHELIGELRAAGAAGATSLRGIWGYHGAHAPHGDSFWQLRRRVPSVSVMIDTPERARACFEIVDRLTAETGLVTSEAVPAFRATGPDVRLGGLALASVPADL